MADWKKIGLFAGGVLFGSAGFRVLGSKDAKKAYTHTTAAGLRVKESVMTTANNIRENCDDILADAKAINEERAAAEEAAIIEDAAVIEDACEVEEAAEEAAPAEAEAAPAEEAEAPAAE